MNQKFATLAGIVPAAVMAISLLPLSAVADEKLKSVIESPERPAEEKARDEYRHPYETLTFFGIEPDMTVVELAPGTGWYTEILAPYLREEGELIGAHVDLESEELPDFYRDIYAAWEERIADTERFGNVEIVAFDPPRKSELGEPGSADMVVTFRSTHGWKGDDVFDDVLEAANDVLKPGGVLGVVQHRLPESGDGEEYTGYVKQSWVVARAEANGFRLVEASEINANPADTADHPEGVWSLPPSLRNVADEDRDAYTEIGESDRMTLKFVKR